MLDYLTKISVTYHESLSNNKNFFFEFQCQYELKYENDVYAHVMNNNFSKIFVRNVINESITLIKRIRLDTVTKYNQTSCYLVISKKVHKVASA